MKSFFEPRQLSQGILVLFLLQAVMFNVEAQTGCHSLDWETDGDGNPLNEGQLVDATTFASIGLSVTTGGPDPILLFNSNDPTGGDVDLASPSQHCPTCTGNCPGISNNGGGQTNCTPLGFILITEEDFVDANGDGFDDDPDDTEPGFFVFCFDAPVTISAVNFIDDSVGFAHFDYADGTSQTITLTGGLDNDAFQVVFGESNVDCMEIELTQSGGISLLDFCYDVPNPVCDLVAPVLGADQSICAGTDPTTVPIDVPASGTAGTIEYQWQQSNVGCVGGFFDIPGATGSTYDPPPINTDLAYRVVTTINLPSEVCIEESNCIQFTIQPNASVNIIDPGPVCINDGLATILANPSGGTFSGANITSAGVFNPVAAGIGTHTISYTFSGGGGCSGSDTMDLIVVPSVNLSTTVNSNACAGLNDGSVTANPSGGTPGYTYAWNDPMMQTTATISNLAPGTYTVIVTDSNGCMATSQAVIVGGGSDCANINVTQN